MTEASKFASSSAVSVVSRCLFIILLAIGTVGCATHTEKDSTVAVAAPVSSVDGETTAKWHYLRFRFVRKDPDVTDSYLDLLVANEVVAPLLSAHRDDLPLWRFHRRWPDDSTGHQFSWIVLATPQAVAQLDEQIRNAPLLNALESDGLLRDFRIGVSKADDPGGLAATSDRAWPPALQREWPYFIMGASRMWLGLVQAEVSRSDIDDLHARYRAVDDTVDELWFREANHALFHHLSALFGYKPVRVIRRDVMTF